MHPETTAVAAGRPPRAPFAPLNPPLVLSSTFHHGGEENRYLREDGTGLLHGFEAALAELNGGGHALAFASGMAATTAVAEGVPVGTVAVTPRASYTGTGRIFGEQVEYGRMEVREVDIGDTEAVLAVLPGADLLWLESATNPTMAVPDLPVLVDAAHQVGATVYLDATFCPPFVQQPLDFGVDVVMHSATKFIAGHSDLLMGALVTRSAPLAERLKARRNVTGAVPGALELFLALRGVRTLAVRMDRAQASALVLAERLAAHPAVERVRFPGLPGDPFHARAAAQQTGFGAMLAFDVRGGEDEAEGVCERVRVVTHATSLGGVESLIERRGRYDADALRGTPPNLLRLSVGIEHVEDLWADLDQALRG